jgi:hypothetical protein
MSKAKQLSRKQIEVINDLFESEKKEIQILQDHKVSWIIYNKWFADKNFIEELDNRIAAAKKRAAAHIAYTASKAIAGLVDLSQGQGETARKACLDLIALQSQATTQPQPQPQAPEQSDSPKSDLSPETASRILAALAEEN